MLRAVADLKREATDARVWSLAWHPTRRLLAATDEARAVVLWGPDAADDAASWRPLLLLDHAHARTVRSCAWHPAGELLATASFDGLVMVWKLERASPEAAHDDFDCIASLEGHENEVKCVRWSTSGSYVATCGRDKAVFVWEADDELYEVASVMHSHTQDVKHVAWHPARDDVLASASYDDTVKLYVSDGDDWRVDATLAGHSSTVWCLAFSADGAGLVTCSDDRSVILWRDESQVGSAAPPRYVRADAAVDVHTRPIFSVSWDHSRGGDGLIATGGGDDRVCLLRAEGIEGGEVSLSVCHVQEGAHASDVNAVAWECTRGVGKDRQGGLLASAGDDGSIRLWSTDSW